MLLLEGSMKIISGEFGKIVEGGEEYPPKKYRVVGKVIKPDWLVEFEREIPVVNVEQPKKDSYKE